MSDLLFDFEKERVPPAVIFATVALIAIFGIGIPYRLVVGF